MLQRTIVGLLMAGILLGALFVGGWGLRIVLYLFLALGMYEMVSALKKANLSCHVFPCAIFMISLPVWVYFFEGAGIAYALLLSSMAMFIQKILSGNVSVEDLAHTMLALVYPGVFFGVIIMMVMLPEDINKLAIVMTVLFACLPDMFAYYVGVFFGRRKLCPQISPKKTVEGSLGAFLGGIIAAVVLYFISPSVFGVPLSIWILGVQGLLCALLAQLGDLTASIVKRSTGIKDYGKIFPGHGGVLDRLDSILFVAPVVLFFVMGI